MYVEKRVRGHVPWVTLEEEREVCQVVEGRGPRCRDCIPEASPSPCAVP